MSGEAGGGYFYPDSEDEVGDAEPVLRRHADHDPALICRPALGYGLCEVLGDEERSDEETPGGDYDVWGLDFGVEGGKA